MSEPCPHLQRVSKLKSCSSLEILLNGTCSCTCLQTDFRLLIARIIKQLNVTLSNGFYFVTHARAASCKGGKNNTLTSIFMKLIPNITYFSEVLVASNARPSKNAIFNKIYAPKSTFEFPRLFVA